MKNERKMENEERRGLMRKVRFGESTVQGRSLKIDHLVIFIQARE